MKKPQLHTLKLDKIVGGGQALGTLEDGRKAFVWGGLPGEEVTVQTTKKKSKYIEGAVVDVHTPSSERITPKDQDSYISTSPWQIMDFAAETHYKASLIEEAFELHDIVLPNAIDVYTDGVEYEYRNKIEFSWWWDNDAEQLDLAFFRRGTKGKIPVEKTSLARPEITEAAIKIRNLVRTKNIEARSLKTLLVRCNQAGDVVAQLYVKDEGVVEFSPEEIKQTDIDGFELIYSNPKSPASVITKRLWRWGKKALDDDILGVNFTYATEGFFQINLPVYEQALSDMKAWVESAPGSGDVIDMYSGVGTIGLTIGGKKPKLIEINEHAVREMRQNIERLDLNAEAILAPSEKALDYINPDATIIVDPPRAGLHDDLIDTLLAHAPGRIVYLSCNTVTQARDCAKLAEKYGIAAHRGYNFFPRTPHIEHLVVLDKIPQA